MPKRIGYLYPELISWKNLYLAYTKACKHKKSKYETAEWMFNCEKYIFELQQELQEYRYRPLPYKYFKIREPKERIISVAAFRDRVVHHALVNVIEPYFEAIFIKDSYATRKEKGLHKAVKAAQVYAHKYSWYLKLDIKKYFESVNHDILLNLINRKIKDPAVMWLCRNILANQTESMQQNAIAHGIKAAKGLPVGNLTSQFFANIYLNQLDHFVIQGLGFKAYIRYMDDFILFSDSSQHLKNALMQIDEYLQHLDLNIKPKSIQINRTMHGIPFLGYRVFPKMIRMRNENLKRCLKAIATAEKAYILGKITEDTLYQSTRSRMGFIGFSDSNALSKAIWGRNQQAVLTV